MARRRSTESAAVGPVVMPAAVVPREALEERRRWYAAQGLVTWPEQYAALQAARAAHGVPPPPDPRATFLDPRA